MDPWLLLTLSKLGDNESWVDLGSVGIFIRSEPITTQTHIIDGLAAMNAEGSNG